jgi:hypothetical protein
LPSCGRGARSESRAMAIAIAPASTARPASCPPMSRGLSGRVAEVVAARMRLALRSECVPALEPALALGAGETVGKSPDGSVELVPPRLGSGGSVTGGGVLLAGVLGDGAAETATAAAEALKAAAPVPLAAAASLICSPRSAAFRTLTVACSSSDCPSARLPTLQTAPLELGQTVKRGESTCAT